MKKFNADYPPAIVSIIAVSAVVILFIPGFMLACGGKESPLSVKITALVTSFLGVVVIAVYNYLYDEVKTVVCFGKGSIIRCRWVCVRWYIDLEKVKYVVYSIEPHHVRGGTFSTFNVEFVSDGEYGEKREYIKVRLDSGQIAECMHGGMDELPIMHLYRFIEANYPEKARGFEER